MSKTLLLEIARCPIVQLCIENSNNDHPCSMVVNIQGTVSIMNHQVPEPWSGHIDTAPILFVSSNPSISELDEFPTGNWTDENIIDFFDNRFGGGKKDWIREGKKGLGRDGKYLGSTQFWASVKLRAEELLEREVEPGKDYALTEIVHCKSKSEIGVREASDFCTDRYFDRILAVSGASIIVVLGSAAREGLGVKFGFPDNKSVLGPIRLGGRERIVTFLPHPNAFKPRSFAKCLSENEMKAIRVFLHNQSRIDFLENQL
jgi:hypothetical protein